MDSSEIIIDSEITSAVILFIEQCGFVPTGQRWVPVKGYVNEYVSAGDMILYWGYLNTEEARALSPALQKLSELVASHPESLASLHNVEKYPYQGLDRIMDTISRWHAKPEIAQGIESWSNLAETGPFTVTRGHPTITVTQCTEEEVLEFERLDKMSGKLKT